jgi:Flp pilus assembly pilin Flp
MKRRIADIIKRFESKNLKRYRNQSGATAVEFALILPVLFGILFGIFQAGIAFNNWISITHAAREGVRLASVGLYDQQKVKDSAPSVEIISVTPSGIGGNIGDSVSVTVVGKALDIQLPFIGHWPIELRSTATMRLETSD